MPIMPVPTATEAKKLGLEQFYGFDPDQEYVIRARQRAYDGRTRGFLFRDGECVAKRIRANATDQQRWDRGERLSQMKQDHSYVVYPRGSEPTPGDEEMWRGQDAPVDTGEERGDTGEVSWPMSSTGE